MIIDSNDVAKRLTLRHLFRLTFVSFSLYLLGDAFFRWDGFSYYASFSEFLPAVALALILWSLVAVFAAIFIWMLFKLFECFLKLIVMEIKMEHLLVYAFIFVLSGALVWKGKKFIWPDVQTTLQLKLMVFMIIAIISGFLAGLFRNNAERWVNAVQEQITPLVWLFGAFVLLSVLLVTYYTLFKGAYRGGPHELTKRPVTETSRPNIVLITFDALAARDMSLYGYPRKTTPFIDEWAKTATVFTRAEAASNFTTSSTASLMTGKRVWTHGVFHLEGSKPLKSEIESLPEELKKNGYFTMGFVVNYHTSVKVLGMEKSFEIALNASEFSNPLSFFGWKFGIADITLYRLFGDKIRLHNWLLQRDFILNKFLNLISRNFNQTEVPPEKAFNRFLEIIDNNLPEPYFAWIHLFPPHDPYLPPEPYRGFFSRSSEFRNFKSQEAIRLETFKYLFQYQPFPKEMQPSIDILRSYYDEFIRYCDDKFKDFIKQLAIRNKLNNTVVILSADHGESFNHGYFTHGGPFLYEQVTHIPLIIKEPGLKKGQTVDTLVEQVDIPATILDIAGIPVPPWMEGRSLVSLMNDETFPQRSAFSMNFEENRSRGHQVSKGSIAVWEGDYKLIHYFKREESLLFNLKQDPDELENLIDIEPEAGRHLLYLVRENLEKANEKMH